MLLVDYWTNAAVLSGNIDLSVLIDLELNGIRALAAGIVFVFPVFCDLKRRLSNAGVGDSHHRTIVRSIYHRLILTQRIRNRPGDGVHVPSSCSSPQLRNSITSRDCPISLTTDLIFQDQVVLCTKVGLSRASSICDNTSFNSCKGNLTKPVIISARKLARCISNTEVSKWYDFILRFISQRGEDIRLSIDPNAYRLPRFCITVIHPCLGNV